jgi:glucosamine--fructose-6-phosphate aminotransferase (isomerizing)
MCGIFCVISKDQTKEIILKGLHSLEYRGYDSAGIAFIQDSNKISSIKAIGKVTNLEEQCNKSQLDSNIAISHTRWATHGEVTLENTHPIHNDSIALVHNGIIENFQDIKEDLITKGYKFNGQTDTEVAVNLLQYHLDQGHEMMAAINKLTAEITGNFSICIISKNDPDKIFCTKKGSPLVISAENDMKYISSDINTLSLFEDNYTMLEDGDIAVVSRSDELTIWQNGIAQKRNRKKITKTTQSKELDHFSSYMEQEIHEQPQVLQNLTEQMFAGTWQKHLAQIDWHKFQRLTIVACGSSYNAGMIAKYWFEKIANISVEVEFSSEFRARDIIFHQDTLYLFISQSGETLDTLVALKKALKNNTKTLSLVNTVESSIAHLTDYILPLDAGVEKSVAATKSFTAQLFHLLNIALYVSHKKKIINKTNYVSVLQDLKNFNYDLRQLLSSNTILEQISNEIIQSKNIIFIGRQEMYPLALEGALKLKELSYLPVHAYAAGELKHGPISLIDKNSVVIALATDNDSLPKVLANVEEVKTRGAHTIIITDTNISHSNNFDHIYQLPFKAATETHYQPIAFSLPLQLIAFQVASKMGLNVDRPRNLAKSVTVE